MNNSPQVIGGSSERRKQVQRIVSGVLQHNFTPAERARLGAVTINLNPGALAKDLVADTGSRRGATDIRLGRNIRANSLNQIFTHEFCHINRRRQGEGFRNEKKIDLETIARLPASGVRNIRSGYYFDEALKFKPGTSMNKKIELVRSQVRSDRRLVTGSVNRSMEGNILERRIDRLYKKSAISKRPKRFQ